MILWIRWDRGASGAISKEDQLIYKNVDILEVCGYSINRRAEMLWCKLSWVISRLLGLGRVNNDRREPRIPFLITRFHMTLHSCRLIPLETSLLKVCAYACVWWPACISVFGVISQTQAWLILRDEIRFQRLPYPTQRAVLRVRIGYGSVHRLNWYNWNSSAFELFL